MKKLLTIVFALGFLASYAQITGSAHDFSDVTGWDAGTGDICTPCHAPHNNLNADGTLLWNHTASAAVGFTMYDSPTLDETIGAAPTGASLLCLSCHDGTTALDAFGGAAGTALPGGSIGGLTGNTALEIGTNFSNDHPISLTYDAGTPVLDAELEDPTVALSGLGGTITADLLDGGGTVECSACHDVHGTANPSLLKIDNANSALCLTCHIK